MFRKSEKGKTWTIVVRFLFDISSKPHFCICSMSMENVCIVYTYWPHSTKNLQLNVIEIRCFFVGMTMKLHYDQIYSYRSIIIARLS